VKAKVKKEAKPTLKKHLALGRDRSEDEEVTVDELKFENE
jgi:hypothetical protein